jgi:hypothetical protein
MSQIIPAAQRRHVPNKLGHGLDELAHRRAGEIEFEPARDTDDKPVASVVVWTFNFRLDSPRKPDAPANIGAGQVTRRDGPRRCAAGAGCPIA